MIGRLRHEALEAARLPEFAGAGIGGVDGKLRRQQHGVDAGIRNLLRHQLAVAHVAFQRRAIAVEEHHDDAGLGGVEILRHVHQHAVVVVGFVLPVDLAAIAAMAATLALWNVQERLVGARIVAEIGKRRGFQADQHGLVFACRRTLIRQRGASEATRYGAGSCCAARFARCVGGCLPEALARPSGNDPWNCGAGNRSSKVSPAEACALAASIAGAGRLAALNQHE